MASGSARPRGTTSTTSTTTSSAGTTRAGPPCTDPTARSPPRRSCCPTWRAPCRLLADEGPSALHTGELARLVTDDVLARGGILGPADLASYRPVVRPSLLTRVGGWTLATTPPPSVGGVVVAAMLRLLEDRPRHGWDADDVARLVAVERAVLGHRHAVLDHSTSLERDARAFLDLVDRDHLGGARVRLDRPRLRHRQRRRRVLGDGVVRVRRRDDREGHRHLAQQLPRRAGAQPAGLHRLPPGSRLLSNMAPTVARHDDGTALAIGSPGADRITTAIAQVLAGFVNGGLSLQEAVNHPRVHVHRAGRADEVVKVETDLTMYYGGVGATLAQPDGHLVAAADPRRDGAVRLVRPTGGG